MFSRLYGKCEICAVLKSTFSLNARKGLTYRLLTQIVCLLIQMEMANLSQSTFTATIRQTKFNVCLLRTLILKPTKKNV